MFSIKNVFVWAMIAARMTPGRAPSLTGGVTSTLSMTAKILAALASATQPSPFSKSASSMPYLVASIRARIESRQLIVLIREIGEAALRRVTVAIITWAGGGGPANATAEIATVGRDVGSGASPRADTPRLTVSRKAAFSR